MIDIPTHLEHLSLSLSFPPRWKVSYEYFNDQGQPVEAATVALAEHAGTLDEREAGAAGISLQIIKPGDPGSSTPAPGVVGPDGKPLPADPAALAAGAKAADPKTVKAAPAATKAPPATSKAPPAGKKVDFKAASVAASSVGDAAPTEVAAADAEAPAAE